MKKLLILGIYLAMPILSEPITIFGLNWDDYKNGLEGIQSDIEEQGFTCENPYGTSIICVNKDKEIEINPVGPVIGFNCHIYNGCDYSIKEVAESISESGIVDLEFKYSLKQKYVNRYSTISYTTYCARGNAGDRLCVEPDAPFMKKEYWKNRVLLYKGSYGEPKMSFDKIEID